MQAKQGLQLLRQERESHSELTAGRSLKMTMQRDDPLHESSTFFFALYIPTVCMTSQRCQECISSNMEIFPRLYQY